MVQGGTNGNAASSCMKLVDADVNEQYEKIKKLKKEDVAKIQDWLKVQSHLPPLTELDVVLFLHSNFYSNESTKRCIENFYTVRAHVPEFFAKMDPHGKEMKTMAQNTAVGVLPNQTPEGYNIIYSRMINTDPGIYSFDTQIKIFVIAAAYHLRQNGCSKGYVLVLDFEGATFAHLARTSPLSAKKMLYFVQECIPLRLKMAHIINPPAIMDKVWAMIKPFLKKETVGMIKIHEKTSVFDHIPKECIPKESGGTGGSVIDVRDRTMRLLEDNRERIVDEEKLIVDESKRQGRPKSAGDLFGVEGTFKKLEID